MTTNVHASRVINRNTLAEAQRLRGLGAIRD
jgi:hypothetical protein